MSLIDTTYFVGDINVPLSSNTDLNTAFTESITRYENAILKRLLGYDLWKEFIDGIAEDEVEQKWIDLRDGAEFTFDFYGNTVSTKWNGLINSDKISLIAYYVYCKHRLANDTHYTGIGEVKSKGENSNAVSSLSKQVWAFNSMVALYGHVPLKVMDVYNFLTCDSYQHFNREPSAYNFLLANKDTYSNWIFEPIARINPFNL
jgi:hypothetical protein